MPIQRSRSQPTGLYDWTTAQCCILHVFHRSGHYVFLRICLLLEATGICSGAWVLAGIHRRIAGFQRDEVYIGTAEERAAKNLGDDDEQLHLGPGHMLKLPGFAEDAPAALKELMESDPSVVDYVKSLHGIKAVGDVETAHGYQSECTEDAEHEA